MFKKTFSSKIGPGFVSAKPEKNSLALEDRSTGK